MIHPHRPLIVALSVSAVLAAPAGAQDTTPPADTPEALRPAPRNDVQFSFSAGGAYHSAREIEDGGEVSVKRVRTSLGARTQLDDNLLLNLSVGYELDDYDFSGFTGFGGRDPWQDVHTVSFAALFTTELDVDWTLYGGPVAQVSFEEGADVGDAWIGGGIIGVRHSYSEDFTLGIGVGVVSQIEDSVRVFPAISLEWQISDDFRLGSSTRSGASGNTGLELIWDAGDEWELAIGGSYAFRRFRLDDDGTGPDGVGEESRIPVWFRASYEVNPSFGLDLYAGVNMGGELRIEDSGGSRIGDRDYDDPATFIGLYGRIRF